MGTGSQKADMANFLQPLHMDVETAAALSREFHKTFQRLAAESMEQFLPTPIAESILRPKAGQEKGRYVVRTGFLGTFISLLERTMAC